uniref:Uncharacterized protein n=1 Tax=Anguilla anguilla TaxID=7936 RepID=A0A0E9V7T6_ANGAN
MFLTVREVLLVKSVLWVFLVILGVDFPRGDQNITLFSVPVLG